MSQQDHATRAQALTAIAGQHSAAPVFGDLGSWLIWNADTMAATALCDLGERSMAPRTRKPNRRRQVPALALLGLAGYLAARKAARP